MIRELTNHKVNGLNEGLRILVLDEPGPGNAHRRYHITTVETAPPVGSGMSPEELQRAIDMMGAVHEFRFQNGNPNECINGISNEALLAIVEDRLACFQTSQFACEENGKALAHVRGAMETLKQRTLARVERGVEGTQVA